MEKSIGGYAMLRYWRAVSINDLRLKFGKVQLDMPTVRDPNKQGRIVSFAQWLSVLLGRISPVGIRVISAFKRQLQSAATPKQE